MKWTLEVVVVPVSDVDRAKTFYTEQLGFSVDHDTGGRSCWRPVASWVARFGVLWSPA